MYDKNDNYEAWAAWQCVNYTRVNVFLTGNAGTGKTTFLRNLQKCGHKRMVVLAPTGVAAINAGGVTIHSFFQIAPSLYIPGAQQKRSFKMRQSKLDLIRSLDLLVIDEVSMVRADLLDCVDGELRAIRRSQLPFGGLQLLLVGDLRQLSPVVRPDEAEVLAQYYSTWYFFGSNALRQTCFYTLELRRIYRQHDGVFIDLLNRVRENRLDARTLALLNGRCDPGFNPKDSEGYIRLTTHNSNADNVNQVRLAMLDGKVCSYEAVVSGTFPESAYPVDASLSLKVGAQVMFLKNDSQTPRRYFNGKIGRVVSLDKETVTVNCDDVGDVVVERFEWENIQYEIDAKTKEVTPKVLGKFAHIPLRLAWAITIHKSQGLTFDRAIIDAANSFSAGQVYVALSRCRTLEGLVLSSPIGAQSVMTDMSVQGFLDDQALRRPDEGVIERHVVEYAFDVAAGLFNFKELARGVARIVRVFEEHCYRTYPRVIENLGVFERVAERDMVSVGVKFGLLCDSQLREGVDIMKDEGLKGRVVNGAKYFLGHMGETFEAVLGESDVQVDNKDVQDQLREARGDLAELVEMKRAMLSAVVAVGFDPEAISRARNEVLLKSVSGVSVPKASGEGGVPADVVNKGLYRSLRSWRRERAGDEGHADQPYVVLSNRVLIDIANAAPRSLDELRQVRGMGAVKVRAYGEDILSLVLADGSASPQQGVLEVKGEGVKSGGRMSGTQRESVELFRRLGSVEAVAKERGLTCGTVRSHLFSTLELSGLTVADVMGERRYVRLCELLEGVSAPLTTELKEKLLGEGFEYSEFYFVHKQLLSES